MNTAVRPISIVLVEDEGPVLDLLAHMMGKVPSLEVVAAVGTLKEAREACRTLRPEILITDLRLPDGSGLDLIRETRQNSPTCEIVVISVLGDQESVVAAISEGASGYLLKDDLADVFEHFIKNLLAGYATLSPSIANYIVRKLQSDFVPQTSKISENVVLSAREKEVLHYIANGLNNKDIAIKLNISINTVSEHVKSIYRKLQVKTRGKAVFEGLKRNIISSEQQS
jgi:DNA-binding NarL/FixJ family response regulator